MGTKEFLGVDTYTKALERIETAYKLFDTLSVGFSVGKDSTCVLNLTLEVARHLNKLPVNVYFDICFNVYFCPFVAGIIGINLLLPPLK